MSLAVVYYGMTTLLTEQSTTYQKYHSNAKSKGQIGKYNIKLYFVINDFSISFCSLVSFDQVMRRFVLKLSNSGRFAFARV